MKVEEAAWEILKSSITIEEELNQEDWNLIVNTLKGVEEEHKIEAILQFCANSSRCYFCAEIYRRRVIDLYLKNNPNNLSIDNVVNLRDRIESNLNNVVKIHKMLSKINILDPSDPHANSSISRANFATSNATANFRAFSATPNFITTSNLVNEENFIKELIGTVKDRRFVPFTDFGGRFPRRLTELQMQEGQLPESKEINLDNYEGLVMMVSGNDSGNWIYSAQIVEVGGAILSAIAKKVFG